MRLLLFFMSCTFYFGFSQTPKHIDIIDVEETNPFPLLLDDNAMPSTIKFNTFNYSAELKNSIQDINFSYTNTNFANNGSAQLILNAFKKDAYTNFKINYRRSELKRLLPKLSDAFDFCPEFSQ